MAVKELTLENFEAEIVNEEKPAIIDFYADWCGPCQMMKPVFERVSADYEGRLKFMKLDTQAESGLAAQFNIQGIPALVVVKGRSEVGRIVGFRAEEQLKADIDEILNKL